MLKVTIMVWYHNFNFSKIILKKHLKRVSIFTMYTDIIFTQFKFKFYAVLFFINIKNNSLPCFQKHFNQL